MKLQITTDYAIRIIIYMAQQGNQVSTARETAKQLGITYNYFNKVATKIRKAGFLGSVQGPEGGYCLSKDAADITLYDIVEAMEGGICINRCLEDGDFCSRYGLNHQVCQVHKIFESLQNQMIDTLKSVKIYDFTSEKIKLR